MKFKMVITALFVTIALASLTQPAAAQFRTVSAAYEIVLSDIRLPRSAGGTIAYRKCAECPYETKRVDGSTVWEINGRAMSLEKFREAIEGVAAPRQETIQVLHHLEQDRVTKVWIQLH